MAGPPASLRELAHRAQMLAAGVEAAHQSLRGQGGEAVRRRSFRLLEVPGALQRLVEDLLATASDLARIAARPAGACGVVWGCAPSTATR
ncbi:hypothetical protein OG339_47250 (plasmid) [Streptosporangium sp. NBC_01495]|uniref:hypothetical protein n=1 Tax=Streptosporangium sp. NBC_01495 TaxID=2903899 RepID=UPI002E2FF5B0|nr:hypothetical protein [Streptosporangium sp. NBC_01495]